MCCLLLQHTLPTPLPLFPLPILACPVNFSFCKMDHKICITTCWRGCILFLFCFSVFFLFLFFYCCCQNKNCCGLGGRWLQPLGAGGGQDKLKTSRIIWRKDGSRLRGMRRSLKHAAKYATILRACERNCQIENGIFPLLFESQKVFYFGRWRWRRRRSRAAESR